MKTYTFDFNSKKNNFNFRNTTATSFLDNYILSGIKKPTDTSDDDIIIINPSKKKPCRSTIDITIKKNKPTMNYNRYDDFLKAMKYFSERKNKDTYDFIIDGTPIKLFTNEIQIGYDLIPLNDFTLDFYKSLSKDTKKNIIDIYISISNK